MPSAQYSIADNFPDSLVTVWGVNADAPLDWFGPYREQYSLTIPILHHASAAFEAYRIGAAYSAYAPSYVLIDRNGIIRHRTVGLYSTAIVEIIDLIDEILEE